MKVYELFALLTYKPFLMVYKTKHENVYNVISKQMWQLCVPKPRYKYVRSHGFVYITLLLFTIYSLRLSYVY